MHAVHGNGVVRTSSTPAEITDCPQHISAAQQPPTCGVTDDQQVVVEGLLDALAAQAQGGGAHALQLGVGAQRCADEGVLGDGVVVQAGQVGLSHVAAVALLWGEGRGRERGEQGRRVMVVRGGGEALEGGLRGGKGMGACVCALGFAVCAMQGIAIDLARSAWIRWWWAMWSGVHEMVG
jgi:hypothetical protein